MILAGSLACSSATWADVKPMPAIELGYSFFSATLKTNSVTGAAAYGVALKSEDVSGYIRPSVGANYLFSSGNATVNGSTVNTGYTMYMAFFNLGFSYFPFSEGYFQPYIGASGVAGWNYFQFTNTTPPGGLDKNTQGMAFGYELSAGTDIRTRQSDSTAFRIGASLVQVSGTVAGKTAFPLTSYRICLGLVL